MVGISKSYFGSNEIMKKIDGETNGELLNQAKMSRRCCDGTVDFKLNVNTIRNAYTRAQRACIVNEQGETEPNSTQWIYDSHLCEMRATSEPLWLIAVMKTMLMLMKMKYNVYLWVGFCAKAFCFFTLACFANSDIFALAFIAALACDSADEVLFGNESVSSSNVCIDDG